MSMGKDVRVRVRVQVLGFRIKVEGQGQDWGLAFGVRFRGLELGLILGLGLGLILGLGLGFLSIRVKRSLPCTAAQGSAKEDYSTNSLNLSIFLQFHPPLLLLTFIVIIQYMSLWAIWPGVGQGASCCEGSLCSQKSSSPARAVPASVSQAHRCLLGQGTGGIQQLPGQL